MRALVLPCEAGDVPKRGLDVRLQFPYGKGCANRIDGRRVGVGRGRVFGEYFEYKFITPNDDQNSSAWLLTFYKHNRAICVTNPANEFHSDARRY